MYDTVGDMAGIVFVEKHDHPSAASEIMTWTKFEEVFSQAGHWLQQLF